MTKAKMINAIIESTMNAWIAVNERDLEIALQYEVITHSKHCLVCSEDLIKKGLLGEWYSLDKLCDELGIDYMEHARENFPELYERYSNIRDAIWNHCTR